jgi:type IV pilus assembly protein PilQ
MKRVWLVAACAALLVPTVASAASVAPPKAASITGLSIRAGAGRADVVIALDGDVDVHDFTLAAPHRVVIDFHGASLGVPARLYDGIARAGITNVRVAQYRSDVVRIVLDLDGPRDYQLVQGAGDVRVSFTTESEFAPWSIQGESVAPVKQAPTVDVSAASSARTSSFTSTAQSQERRITVAWRNASIRDVAQDFAVFAGRSIVVGSSVNAIISAEIIDQPWDVALNSILRAQGLAATTGIGGIITIDSYQSLQAQAATEPLAKEIVPLNYAKAEELFTTIQALLSRECGGSSVPVVGGGAPGQAGAPPPPTTGGQGNPSGQCAPRGSVVAEKQSNSLVIFEVGSRIAELISYAKSFDFKTQQVHIKAKIIAVNRTGTERLGISYDLGSATSFFNTLAPRTPAGGGGGQQQATEFQVGLGGDAFAGVANANRSYGADAALSLIASTTLGNFSLSAFLDALSQEELSDVQAEPSVNTLDKREATLFVGEGISFLLTPPTAPGAIQAAAPQIQQQEFGILLKVTPSISANRSVRMIVTAEQSSLMAVTIAGPNISKRNVSNEVIVRDGETVVIGGLTQTQVSRTRRGIPFLYQLPLIGRLFSENESIERKQDLLILITPHILDDEEPPPVRRDQ